MSRTARLVRALAVAVVLAGSTLSTGWGMLFFAPLPTIDGHYRFLGLNARAEVVRDIRGVAHVYAGDEHDLFFLQGYVTAQDRLVQLEQLRRMARARGAPSAETGASESGVERALVAYAAGITKLIDQYDEAGVLPGELVLAGISPEPWTPADLLAIAAAFGAPRGGSRCRVAVATLRGAPILSADVHVDVPAPGPYEIVLRSPGLSAAGIALPGVPGVIAGHNGVAAWAYMPGPEEVDAPAALRDIVRAMRASSSADLRGPGCAADRAGGASPGHPDVPVAADLELMRSALGPPRAATGARIVIDLADVDSSRSALSHGVSGLRLSSHFEDQRAIWEVGQLHALPFSRAAIGVTDGELVLRPR